MAREIYCDITGPTLGHISAGAGTDDSVAVEAKDSHPDECQIIEVNHDFYRPTDPHSGQPTGNRIHCPFRVLKLLDSASPLLAQALEKGEQMDVVFSFYRQMVGVAGEEKYYEIKLSKAVVVKLSLQVPNIKDPKKAHLNQLEEVSFAYNKIEWNHLKSSKSHTDEWRAA